MHVISVDVATKSLAVSIINYNLTISDQIANLYKIYINEKNSLLGLLLGDNTTTNTNTDKNIILNQILDKYVKLLDNITKYYNDKMVINYLDVVDLIPNQKVKETTTIMRTSKLHAYLHNLDNIIIKNTYSNNCIFLIEYQMGPNDKSRVISSQIMYHFTKYTNNTNNQIYLVGPSLKNKIVIGNDNSLYANFLEKYQTNYTANKNHSKYNFLQLLKYLKKEDLTKNILAKNLDDIADSVLMSLAYILTNYTF